MKLRLINAANRDGEADGRSITPAPPPRLGQEGRPVSFRRYLAAAEGGTHDELVHRFGGDYAAALVAGDPEVDMELVGRGIGETDTVFLSSTGEVMYAAPEIVEIVTGPDGVERERRTPVDVAGNVDLPEAPIRMGRKFRIADAVRQFLFTRTVQIRHTSGLEYDWLHGIAKELAGEGVMVLLAGGPKGRDPLVFQTNGTPWRGFLEGRVADEGRYQLLLHLSKMKLERPSGEPA